MHRSNSILISYTCSYNKKIMKVLLFLYAPILRCDLLNLLEIMRAIPIRGGGGGGGGGNRAFSRSDSDS